MASRKSASHVDKQREPSNYPSANSTPMAVFSSTLMSSIQTASSNGRKVEREEIVCRLLASGMPVEEISIVLNLRRREVEIIQMNNVKIKIPDYEKKLKQRRERRLKATQL